MGATMKVDIDSRAVDALLKSRDVRADLERRGAAIAAAAGEGMEVDSSVGATRARVVIFTDTFPARRAEASRRALTSALDAGR